MLEPERAHLRRNIIAMKNSPTIVVLAAGRGSRFSGPQHKLAQALGAATVMGQTIAHAVASGLPLVVVTTEALAAEAARWVARRELVLLPEAAATGERLLGMGYSLAAGVQARPHASGWLVLPADMPLVRPATLQAVAAALVQQAVVYAQYRGRRGHPVGFAAELYSDLVQLKGDEGACRVMARYPSTGLELDDPGVLQDVDTEADLAHLRAAVGASAVNAGAPAAPVVRTR